MRHITTLAVLVLIPIALLGPIVFGKWREARRDRRINEARATARKIEGLSYKEMTRAVPVHDGGVCLIFTGNTGGDLNHVDAMLDKREA